MELLKFWILYLRLLTICECGSVSRVGNEIRPSLSGVDIPGATFLQRDIVLTEGVVFAYSAFFRSNKPVTFQIWRPETSYNTDPGAVAHRLLAQTRVTPSVVLSREDVYIESRLTEKCFRVREGDRLGVFFEASPGSISYVFNDAAPTALGHRLANLNDPYNINDIVPFDSLLFPYDFSVAAYIDTDPSHYGNTPQGTELVDCFPHVLIPEYEDLDLDTTTRRPITGAPGATGATGPSGHTGGRGRTGPNGLPGQNGELGGTGPMGPIGVRGLIGATGSTGLRGLVGSPGATGPPGPNGNDGDPGPAGARGPPGNILLVTNNTGLRPVDWEHEHGLFSSANMSLGYLVWLVVLTLIAIAMVIVVIVIARRMRKQREPIDLYRKARIPSLPSTVRVRESQGFDNNSASWKDFLKTETETSYSNDTLDGDHESPPFTYEHDVSVPEFMY